jgi:phosphatidylglycerophosphate synthase
VSPVPLLVIPMNGGVVRPVQRDLLTALAGQVLLLAGLASTAGLGTSGWAVGLALAIVGDLALATAFARIGRAALSQADRVTLTRASLVCGVGALVAQGAPPVTLLVTLAAVALVLDAVDGRVARATGTTSRLGARFDMEVDAVLILLLSVYVAGSVGLWVLAAGVARYALWLAGRLLPWLRRESPPRFWGKVVAALQGVVLVAAAADALPRPLTVLLLVAALVLLAESFGRQVLWLWRRREPKPVRAAPAPQRVAA